MIQKTDVAIIGGGIAGTTVASHLCARTNFDVTIFERASMVGTETTSRSGAFVGHWGHESSPRLRMMRTAIASYNELLASSELTFRRTPRFNLATTSEGARELSEILPKRRIADSASPVERGTLFQYFSGDHLDNSFLLPGLETTEIVGSVYAPNLGYLDGNSLTETIARHAREEGASIVTNALVEEILQKGESATGVVVNGETVRAEHVVCAAGPWNLTLLSTAGVHLPIRHTLAPVLRYEPEATLPPSLPSIQHHESGYYLRREENGTLFIGHYPGSYHDAGTVYNPDTMTDVPPNIREGAREVLERFIPDARKGKVVNSAIGIRSLTPDAEPIIGETDIDNLSVVAFNANGIQLSPIAGRIITAALDGDTTKFDDIVNPMRFDDYS